MTNHSDVAVKRGDVRTAAVRAGAKEQYSTPRADIVQTPDAYLLMLDIPGATRESINVSLEGETLAVRAAVEPLHKEDASLLFRELRGTGYYRVFTVGNDIDMNNVDARYENGVLTVKLYKSEQSRPREISIR